jgi:glutamate dehydrogenase (NAD(P)+)
MKNGFNEIDIEFSLQGKAQAFVSLHTIINGTSSGGMRICSDLTREEVRALSREMTLKFSAFELARGGAKSGIRIPPDLKIEQRQEILKEIGRRIAPLIHLGLYYPGTDLNCTRDDLRIIYESAGLQLGKITDTSYFTALSVANAIEVIRLLKQSTKPLRIAIEGFGSVSSHLVSRLSREHYSVNAISTINGAVLNEKGFSLTDLVAAQREYGDDCLSYLPTGQKLARKSLLEVETDILVPAARTWSITGENVDAINAKWIVSAANVPCTCNAVARLQERGVVFLPGFICNAGGVFGSTLFDVGVPKDNIEETSRTLYRDVVAALIKRASASGRSATDIAEKVAIKRYQQMAAKSAHRAKTVSLFMKALQRDVLPKPLYGRFRLLQFKNCLRSLAQEITEA